jgi:hypothetical protein
VSHLIDHIRDTYQTGTGATLLVLALCLALMIFGFITIVHFSDLYGWTDVVLGPLLFLAFHKQARRDDSESRN